MVYAFLMVIVGSLISGFALGRVGLAKRTAEKNAAEDRLRTYEDRIDAEFRTAVGNVRTEVAAALQRVRAKL